ncbi:LOW QUALITY PROTEIN: 1-phosphatidylinositol 4,5-bisphosphate phosphodiesterase classes I and II-like [Pollicipes pollicipes]|uniref:LOW QUALITY PROTEIN: 1-phosphatidylinositol 4,5-bisphosphate phosphodiesterase classes I and II-like n=1 Tax=Pollicipes pollicipes TaxID=41117 RepID=UPI0018852FBA|nr:LOW QUALITY PROTEIN: 1-phosphatidylinositol 4,5-bisphosphate phosphodiesterase classes I and II-like [Pollicipes pollicipes]
MAGYRPAVHVVQLKPVVVPQCMQEGQKFIKWDEDSPTGVPVTLKVDPNGFYLYVMDQNKEVELLDIMTIRDTRTGRYARTPKDQRVREIVTMGSTGTLEEKTVTVCYGPDVVNVNFVNFCCNKMETAKLWTDELLKMAYNLLALHASVTTLLQKAHTRICRDVDRTGRIPVKHVVKSLANNKEDRKRVEKALEASGLPSGKSDTLEPEMFTFKHFLAFYMHLTGRQEIERIFDELCGGNKRKGHMTVQQVVDFLNKEQRDPRLNEILYPYVDPQKAREIIAQYEPNKANVQKGLLSLEGFMQYLMGDDNAIVPPEKYDQCDDMEQPMSHYFINSSHNTYLAGHQLTGRSSVEIYRQCLLMGCRCVELDFWNGRTEEPIVCHGYTLVPEIPAKDVIEAIAEAAFKTSDWPVILSFENHCNPKQQAKIAQYCRELFGDMLLDAPLEDHPLVPGASLPPPTALRRKILIKNKKKHHKPKVVVKHSDTTFHVPVESTGPSEALGNGDVARPAAPLEKHPSQPEPDEPDEDEAGSSSDSDEDSLSPEERRLRERTQKETGTAGKESEAGAEISALVNYVQPGHFHSFAEAERRDRSYEMSSLVETQATALLKAHPVEFVNYNKRQLSRVYPRGTRVDSSNFMPQVFWNAGCQLVALNYQTLDLAMQLNTGIFEYNHRSGYLLKPEFMRRPDRRFDPFAESTVDGIIAGTVSVKVISGQFLSEKRVGVWVEVDMYGLPADTVRRRFRTRVIQNNAINPVWDDETFVFKKVVLPDLACIRVAAFEESGRLLGHRVLPVIGLRPGYRHISLRNESGQPQGLSTLFVKVKVGDYVPDGLSDFAEALANPIKYQSEREKRSLQLRVLTDEGDEAEQPAATEEDDTLCVLPSATSPAGCARRNGADRDGGCAVGGLEPPAAAAAAAAAGQEANGTGGPGLSPATLPDLSIMHRRVDSMKNPRVTGSNEDVPTPDHLLTAVPIDLLWEEKPVRERRQELERKVESLRRKLDRERVKLQEAGSGGPAGRKNTFSKTHSKLVKKFSNKTMEGMSLSVPDPADQTAMESFCSQLAASEKELRDRHIDLIYDALDKVVRTSQAAQRKNLQAYHERRVAECKKKIELDRKEASKELVKKGVSKDEMSRLRREMSQVIVKAGVQRRERLTELQQQDVQSLNQQHEQVLQQVQERRETAHQQLSSEQEARLGQLTREWVYTSDTALT